MTLRDAFHASMEEVQPSEQLVAETLKKMEAPAPQKQRAYMRYVRVAAVAACCVVIAVTAAVLHPNDEKLPVDSVQQTGEIAQTTEPVSDTTPSQSVTTAGTGASGETTTTAVDTSPPANGSTTTTLASQPGVTPQTTSSGATDTPTGSSTQETEVLHTTILGPSGGTTTTTTTTTEEQLDVPTATTQTSTEINVTETLKTDGQLTTSESFTTTTPWLTTTESFTTTTPWRTTTTPPYTTTTTPLWTTTTPPYTTTTTAATSISFTTPEDTQDTSETDAGNTTGDAYEIGSLTVGTIALPLWEVVDLYTVGDGDTTGEQLDTSGVLKRFGVLLPDAIAGMSCNEAQASVLTYEDGSVSDITFTYGDASSGYDNTKSVTITIGNASPCYSGYHFAYRGFPYLTVDGEQNKWLLGVYRPVYASGILTDTQNWCATVQCGNLGIQVYGEQLTASEMSDLLEALVS